MTADAEYIVPEGHALDTRLVLRTGRPNAESPPDLQEPARKRRPNEIAVGCTQGRTPLSRGLLETLCKCSAIVDRFAGWRQNYAPS